MALRWKYIDNQMDIATAGSVKEAVVLSRYHDAGLLALVGIYPILQDRYDQYHPAHLALVEGYNSLDSSDGAKQGDRLTVEQFFTAAKILLTTEWMPAILMVYKKISARFKSIFPNGLKPFYTGGIDEKIESFNTLSKNIGVDANLTSVKASVDGTYNHLVLARNNQLGAKATTAISSDALEVLRVNAMVLEYKNVAFVMLNLFEHRESILPLIIDLVTLREKVQSIYTGSILAGKTIAILAHTFLNTDSIRVNISGIGAYKLFLSTTNTGIDSKAILVNANLKTDILVSGFGVTDFVNHRFLNMINESGDVATYRIELL